MTQNQRELLNEFFVGVFNKVLIWEEATMKSIGCKNLSVNELHILEAVHALAQLGQNTMSAVAKRLSISVSALSTAVNALVRKDFLRRSGSPSDRRTVLVTLTEKGELAERIHHEFHEKMVDGVGNTLSDVELFTLLASLARLGDFFDTSANGSPEEDVAVSAHP